MGKKWERCAGRLDVYWTALEVISCAAQPPNSGRKKKFKFSCITLTLWFLSGRVFLQLLHPGLPVGSTHCLFFTVTSSRLLVVALSVCLFVWFFNNLGFLSPVTCRSFLLLSPELFDSSPLSFFYLCFLLSVTLCCLSPSCRHLLCFFFHSMSLSLSLLDSNFPFPFLSSSLHLLLFFLSPPRVTLDPSKRQSSNKSMSGCTLPQGTKTVSKSSFPMFSGCFCPSVWLSACLPVPRHPLCPLIRCLLRVGV